MRASVLLSLFMAAASAATQSTYAETLTLAPESPPLVTLRTVAVYRRANVTTTSEGKAKGTGRTTTAEETATNDKATAKKTATISTAAVQISPLPLSTLNTTVNFATFTLPDTSSATTSTGKSKASSTDKSKTTADSPFGNSTTTHTQTRTVITATAIRTQTVTSTSTDGAAGRARKTGAAQQSALLPAASNVPATIPALGAGTGAQTENPVKTSAAPERTVSLCGGSSMVTAMMLALFVSMAFLEV